LSQSPSILVTIAVVVAVAIAIVLVLIVVVITIVVVVVVIVTIVIVVVIAIIVGICPLLLSFIIVRCRPSITVAIRRPLSFVAICHNSVNVHSSGSFCPLTFVH
jgi:hypothetical protein